MHGVLPFKTEGSFAYDMNAGCSSATVGGSYIRANVDISAHQMSARLISMLVTHKKKELYSKPD